MKQLGVFIKKEFYHVFRDKKTLLLLFGLPIAQVLLFGFALTNEIKNSKIVICDFAKDETSRQLIEKISASESFEIDDNLQSINQIENEFKKGKVKLAVVFPANFGNDILHQGGSQMQIIADASDPNTATTLVNYVTNIVNDYQSTTFGKLSKFLKIETSTRMIYNPELKGTTNFVPGVMALVLLLICVLMTSVSIVKEKEMGTMEILLVSPLHPVLVIISKAIPYFLLSLVNFTLIIILSVTLMDMPMHGGLLTLYLASSIFILTALALGLLISNATNSQQAAMLISLMGMLMPTMMFTGFMFPLENMPVALQWLANIIPSKWYYLIVKDIMIKGQGITYIWKELLILSGMTLFLVVVSIKKFKIRLA
jgi:ABC-2 type transport system permease protein